MTRPARWPFVAALAAFAAAVGLLTAFALWRMQVDEVASGFEASALQSRNLEALVTHSLHTAQQVAASALPDAQDELDADRFVARLIPSLRHVPFLRSVSLLDAQGQVVASSNPANLGLRIDTASYFPQAQAQQVLLRIGPPWAGRDFADGRAASALNPDDGDVPGFVAAQHQVMLEGRPMSVLYALNSDYFVNLGMQAVGAPPSSVTVVRHDGMVLMSTDPGVRAGTMDPVVMQAVGRAEVETDRLEEDQAGGRRSLTTLRASRLYPLFVVTRLDRDQVMQHWWTEARTLAAVELPLLVAISLVTAWLYRRRLQWHRQSAEAQHQQRLHATVFGASNEGIFITDRSGRILSINPAFTRITGYAPADALGKRIWALVPKDLPATTRRQVHSAIKQHGSWQGELASRRKDGSLFDALVSIAISYDEQGHLQHIIGDVADITERKLAQQALRVSEERFRSLTELS